MAKQKIILVNDYFPVIKGGAEYQAYNIGLLFKEHGYEVIFVSLGFEKDYVFTDDNQFKIYAFKSPQSIFDTFSLYWFFSKKLCEVIKLEHPNLVYQRVLNSFSSYIAKTCYQLSIPYHLHIADNYCFDFNFTMRGQMKKMLFHWLLKYPVSFICQTQEQVHKLEKYRRTAIILPNLLNLSLVDAEKDNTNFMVLWIANIRPVKQLNKFLLLAKECAHNTHIEFVVIGRNDGMSQEEESTLNKLPNIKYLGELNQTMVLKHMELAHVLVNTSISEGFSNTFIQAWSRSMPVLSLNVDPNNLIAHYNAGIVGNGSITKLKDTLLLLAEKEELYNKYVKHAQQLFLNQFNYQKNKDKLLSYFNINNG